jgi:ribulose-5-phosphate 4-epimerase/fuculose-1-phosphate aldolase
MFDPHDMPTPPAIAELSQGCRVLAMEDHDDKTLGHVSYRDPAGRGFWVKRTGISLAEVASPADFLLLDFDGNLLSGVPFRPREWPIHAEIYRARPDLNAIGHTHPYHACVMAATEEPVAGVTREGSLLRPRVRRFRTTSNLVSTPELGAALAGALGDGLVVLMRNHGVTFCGATIGECILTGVMLERACHAQLKAAVSSYPWSQSDSTHQHLTAKGALDQPAIINRRWSYYRRRLALLERRRGVAEGVPRPAPEPVPAGATARDVALSELAVSHRILAMEGHAENTAGAITLRDPGGDGYWTKIPGSGMDEVFGPAQMIFIGFDGHRIAGSGSVPSSAVLRAAILKARPDVNAVVYSRAFHAVVFSATDQPLLPIGEDARHFNYNVPVVTEVTGPVRDPAAARTVVGKMGDASGLLIKNMGMVTVGESLMVATLRAIALNHACHQQLTAEASGFEWNWDSSNGEGEPRNGMGTQERMETYWRYYCRKLERHEAGRPLPGE